MTTDKILEYSDSFIQLIDLSGDSIEKYIMTRDKTYLKISDKINELLQEVAKTAIREFDNEKSKQNN